MSDILGNELPKVQKMAVQQGQCNRNSILDYFLSSKYFTGRAF